MCFCSGQHVGSNRNVEESLKAKEVIKINLKHITHLKCKGYRLKKVPETDLEKNISSEIVLKTANTQI